MTRRLLLPLTVLLVLAVVAFVLTRGADRSDRAASADPQEDPCAYLEEPTEPDLGSVEITRVDVRHRTSEVRVTVQVRDLPEGLDLVTTVSLRTSTRDAAVNVLRDVDGGSDAWLTDLPDLEALSEATGDECRVVGVSSIGQPCPSLRGEADDDRGRVVVVVPRSCLGSPRWVQVGVRVFASDPTDPQLTWTATWPGPTGDGGPFGPTVPVERVAGR